MTNLCALRPFDRICFPLAHHNAGRRRSTAGKLLQSLEERAFRDGSNQVKSVVDKYFGAHEFQAREEVHKTSSNRGFGLVFAAFFALLGGLSLYEHGSRWPIWFGLAAVFAAAALLVPHLLAPLNRIWAKFGLLLHAVVSPLILGILFFLCITPIGFLMRLSGKDPLRLKLDPDATSYWLPRQPPGPAGDSFKNQF
jgi:hypothetical protein